MPAASAIFRPCSPTNQPSMLSMTLVRLAYWDVLHATGATDLLEGGL